MASCAGQIGQLKNLIWTSVFPWENSLGFFLAGSVGHDFVAPYSVTLDFSRMVMTFSQSPETRGSLQLLCGTLSIPPPVL
jgi:hypothetical protein